MRTREAVEPNDGLPPAPGPVRELERSQTLLLTTEASAT
jgi:hypothetical protein